MISKTSYFSIDFSFSLEKSKQERPSTLQMHKLHPKFIPKCIFSHKRIQTYRREYLVVPLPLPSAYTSQKSSM
ncbi:hypothetical protein AQUCO_01200014v1 [Aquilegia coerulea]|uniref:Uncharacterized protein n=1 Tax=Aquilegia coerulea TaxID=218851 RepID=A0A2G5E470_AQUCA|nr:hypothetical protein AQUCO_01200014v1 [Aquilegia coerulea]